MSIHNCTLFVCHEPGNKSLIYPRQEWDDEVSRMRHDFFRLKPSETRRGSSENLLESRRLSNIFLDDPTAKAGGKRFCVSFDVREFGTDEISVTTDEQRLLVNARHEEVGDDRTLTRQFSRTIDIPNHVDPSTLQCTLSNDGILQVRSKVTKEWLFNPACFCG